MARGKFSTPLFTSGSCLAETKASHHVDMWGSEDIAPHVLKLGTLFLAVTSSEVSYYHNLSLLGKPLIK
jgi:hypothetical protein